MKMNLEYLQTVDNLGLDMLTHLPLALHICISESGQNWFR